MSGSLRTIPSILLTGILPFGAIFVELYFIMTSLWTNKIYYMFGFLFLCYGLMIITSAATTVLLVYFLLCAENYRWHWRAFFGAGMTGGYVFLNALIFWATRVSFGGLTGTVLYVGYSALIGFVVFILTGMLSPVFFLTIPADGPDCRIHRRLRQLGIHPPHLWIDQGGLNGLHGAFSLFVRIPMSGVVFFPFYFFLKCVCECVCVGDGLFFNYIVQNKVSIVLNETVQSYIIMFRAARVPPGCSGLSLTRHSDNHLSWTLSLSHPHSFFNLLASGIALSFLCRLSFARPFLHPINHPVLSLATTDLSPYLRLRHPPLVPRVIHHFLVSLPARPFHLCFTTYMSLELSILGSAV